MQERGNKEAGVALGHFLKAPNPIHTSSVSLFAKWSPAKRGTKKKGQGWERGRECTQSFCITMVEHTNSIRQPDTAMTAWEGLPTAIHCDAKQGHTKL